ncbi:unnamed protein product, partial [Rotaria sp. Silwood1]
MSANLHLSFQDDAYKFYDIVEKLNRENCEQVLTDQLNKHWIRLFAKTCTGDLCPIQSVMGGIATEEAINCMPIRQFLYFDPIECLPENVFHPSNETTNESNTRSNFSSKQSRYYSQEVVFGEDFQDKLGNAKYFL